MYSDDLLFFVNIDVALKVLNPIFWKDTYFVEEFLWFVKITELILTFT